MSEEYIINYLDTHDEINFYDLMFNNISDPTEKQIENIIGHLKTCENIQTMKFVEHNGVFEFYTNKFTIELPPNVKKLIFYNAEDDEYTNIKYNDKLEHIMFICNYWSDEGIIKILSNLPISLQQIEFSIFEHVLGSIFIENFEDKYKILYDEFGCEKYILPYGCKINFTVHKLN